MDPFINSSGKLCCAAKSRKAQKQRKDTVRRITKQNMNRMQLKSGPNFNLTIMVSRDILYILYTDVMYCYFKVLLLYSRL